MMLIITWARGVRGKIDKNGAIWCILSVPKLVIINLKVNIFLDNKSTTKIFSAIFFSKINPHKNKYIHILQGGSEGGGGGG